MSIFDVLVLALLATWCARAIHRIRRGMGGPIPDVPDAPPGAEPMASVGYDDNGLATYSYRWLPPSFREESESETDSGLVHRDRQEVRFEAHPPER